MGILNEIVSSVYGCYKLAIRDKSALSYFNMSAGGFWSSFTAVLLSLLITILHRGLELRFLPDEVDGFSYTIAIGVAIITSWLLYLATTAVLSKYFGFSNQFGGFVIAYNWSQFTLIAIQLVLSIFTMGLFGPSLATIIGLLFVGLSYVYLWYILKETLQVTGSVAVALAFMEFLIALLVQKTALDLIL